MYTYFFVIFAYMERDHHVSIHLVWNNKARMWNPPLLTHASHVKKRVYPSLSHTKCFWYVGGAFCFCFAFFSYCLYFFPCCQTTFFYFITLRVYQCICAHEKAFFFSSCLPLLPFDTYTLYNLANICNAQFIIYIYV